MVNLSNILLTAGKKITKAIVKKEAREHSDTIDEFSNSTALNPFDVKPLNEGEDERIEQILKSKETYEPYYKKQLEKLNQQQKLIQDINQNNNAEEDILYKHPSQITEAEIKNSMIYSGYKTSDCELKEQLQKKQKDWFDFYYGTDVIKQDASGKNISPSAKHSIPDTLIELTTKDKLPLKQGFDKIAEYTSKNDVKTLQNRLNSLYREDTSLPQLKEDGVIGKKTTSRIKKALIEFGVNKITQN